MLSSPTPLERCNERRSGPSSVQRVRLGWWTLIEDLRTSLKKNPVSMDVIKDLLGEAA